MLDQGFLEREKFGDLRDLIARRHWEHAAVTVNANETVLAAYRRMKLYDVSQIPVLEDGNIVGIVDEEDILMEVFSTPSTSASRCGWRWRRTSSPCRWTRRCRS